MSVNKIRDINLSSPVAVSERRFSAPFDGDITQYVHEQDFIQDVSKFRPLALSSPDAPDYPASFLVEETAPQFAGPGVVRWTRVYSRIPTRRMDGESYAWTIPGIATEAVYSSLSVDNANSLNVGNNRTKITTQSDHKLLPGDYVSIVFTIALGDIEQTYTVNREVLGSGATGAVLGVRAFEVDIVLDSDPTYFTVTKVDGGRDPITKIVHSYLQFDYFLPGIPGQVKSFQAIPIIQPVIIRDNAGKETNTYSLTSSPTKAQYITDVIQGKLVVPEASTIRRWRGNIFERVTRFVHAQ